MDPVDETHGAEMSTVASRVASICALVDVAPDETMSARRVAAISAMIHDVTDETTTSSRIKRKRRRMGSARSYEETRTLRETEYDLVSKARHRATGQTVVLRALQPVCGISVGVLLHEACIMAACRGHPNIVALHGMARAPGTSDYSIVTEFVGPTLERALHDRIGRLGRPFTEAEVRGIMRQLLSGAAAMHSHGIIHQDITPKHIFVSGTGDDDDTALTVKIGHYGSAMSTAEPDAYDRYRFAGTWEYMAPETKVWTDYGTRVDTWSLGCVMAELLTGERLFEVVKGLATNQLYKIFDLLGVPGKKAYREFKAPSTDELVDLWRREQQQRAQHRSRLREKIPEKTLSKEGFEVLKGLLTCIPSKRLDAAAALQLPWFAHTEHHSSVPVVAAEVSKSGGAAAGI
ncbi:putative cyclin-dependent kinase F-2 [Lolium rigidum]|uniref:putative cyclin-dependent kinase F-2 n=1 Tax=Lolium rigidum TaxID=89674 RepID=UPI001F5C4865|nr:putative cyclin-dependent kinase F-2 [Lolium rigidum]